MTVNSETARVRYQGNGVTTDFSTGFVFLDNAHVRALLDDAELVENTDYTLTGEGSGTAGTLTMLTAPAADEYLTIIRDVPFTQEIDGTDLMVFDADDQEAALDKIWHGMGQLKEKLSRTLASSETGAGGEPVVASWLPVLAVVADGARRVVKIVDWYGGVGTKPPAGYYITATGVSLNIADGTDIRGAQGEPGLSGNGTGDVIAANNLSDLANKNTALDNLHIVSSDVTAASTLDLSGTGGWFVNVLGSTSINQITLPAGKARLCHFHDTVQINHGTYLWLPGEATITAVQYDAALFVGLGGGYVICAFFQRFDGKALVETQTGYVLPESVLHTTGNKTLTGGFLFTPYNGGTVSSGTFTPAAANGNYQYYTNNGAHTLAVPAADCAIDILITNGASAGAITLSGSYALAANYGDAYGTGNGQKYIFSIRRIAGTSTLTIKALQ